MIKVQVGSPGLEKKKDYHRAEKREEVVVMYALRKQNQICTNPFKAMLVIIIVCEATRCWLNDPKDK